MTTSFAKTLEVTAAGVRKDVSLDTLCGKLGVSREHFVKPKKQIEGANDEGAVV